MLFDRLHRAFADEHHLAIFSVTGVVIGVITTLIIAAFKTGFESLSGFFIGTGNPEAFETLAWPARLLLPVLGGVLLGLAFHFLKLANVRVGLPHAVYSVQKDHAKFPVKNIIAQFFGGIVALGTGHSVGQEGPAVHLGAGSGAALARKFNMPDNSLRLTAGCGCAAAIATTFGTPLAGVIFAMEVLLLEYSVLGFIPIILAAIAATALRETLGLSDFYLQVPAAITMDTSNIIWFSLLALAIACSAALLVRCTQLWLRLSTLHVINRFAVAGIVTGLIALSVPEVMGTGTDTLTSLSSGHFALIAAILLIVGKIVATSCAVGSGIPGGLIGPSLLIGAAVGSAVAAVTAQFFSTPIEPALLVLLGMAGMMSCSINAPLAAIIFVVELSFSSALLWPGLLVVVLSNIIFLAGFRQSSLVALIFRHQGLDLNRSAVIRALASKNVMQLMNSSLKQVAKDAEPKLAESDYEVVYDKTTLLLRSPLNPEWQVCEAISTTASLLDARKQMLQNNSDALICARRTLRGDIYVGVLERAKIEGFLLN